MKNLEVIQEAGRSCAPIGHFNIADLVLLRGVWLGHGEIIWHRLRPCRRVAIYARFGHALPEKNGDESWV
jgi:hypothetical protein